jgi:hypothetical protein
VIGHRGAGLEVLLGGIGIRGLDLLVHSFSCSFLRRLDSRMALDSPVQP